MRDVPFPRPGIALVESIACLFVQKDFLQLVHQTSETPMPMNSAKPITFTDSTLCLLTGLRFGGQLLTSFVFQRVANVCLAIRVCGVCDIDNSTLAYRLEQRA